MEEVGKWRVPFALLLLICVFGIPGASAQPRERLAGALDDLTSAIDGTYGDEGPRIMAAIDALAASLAAWDDAVASVEARFASELKDATPETRARLHASLALVYLDRGRLSDAARELDASVRLNGADGEVQALRARVAAVVGTPSDSAAAAAQAWLVAPADMALAALLATASADRDDPNVRKALEALRGSGARLLAARAPGAPPFLAFSLVDDAAASQPVLVPGLYAAGYALMQRGAYAQAIAQLRRAAARDPMIGDRALSSPLAAKGMAALRAGDNQAALPLLTAASAAQPNSATLRRLLGSACRAVGQDAQAVEHLTAAMRLAGASGDDRAGIVLADLHLDERETDAAERVLLETARAQPQSGRAHFRLGVLYQAQRREADALQAFEAAAAAGPLAGAGRLHVTIGRLRENQLDAAGADEAFRHALRINPNDAVGHRERGEVLRAGGRSDAALAEFLTALLIDPLDADTWTAVGQAEAAAGRDVDALGPLDRAIELNPRQREAHYARAQALLRLGRDAEGRAALEAFRRLQAEAMEVERRSYEQNLRAIETDLQKPAETAR